MGVAAAVAVGSALVSYQQQKSMASAQKKQQEAYNQRVQEEAIRQYGELDESERDIQYDSHQASLQAQKEYLQARSTIELQSASSGTFGQSVDLAIQNLRAGRERAVSDIILQRDQALSDVNRASRDIQRGAAASFNYSPIQKPSILDAASTGLRTYSAVSGAVSQYEKASEQAAPARR